LLGVGRQQYYAWLHNGNKRNLRQEELDKLIAQIKAEHDNSNKIYGSRKITFELQKKSLKVGRNKVSRIMSNIGIKSKVCRKYKVCTTDSNHNLPIYENKLNREFTVTKQNYAWCSDITYCHTNEGWLYLATVIDLFSNKVIGYATSNKIDKWLVVKALSKALQARGYPQRVIAHTDRGSQYCSKQYRNLIKANKLIGSMSRKGNCWDNAVAENFFGLIKKEFLNHYTFETHASARLGIFNYINGWYNPHRSHSKLGYLSPDEFENKNLGIVSSPVLAKYKKYPMILQNLAKQVATMS
jgi:putative transposase